MSRSRGKSGRSDRRRSRVFPGNRPPGSLRKRRLRLRRPPLRTEGAPWFLRLNWPSGGPATLAGVANGARGSGMSIASTSPRRTRRQDAQYPVFAVIGCRSPVLLPSLSRNSAPVRSGCQARMHARLDAGRVQILTARATTGQTNTRPSPRSLPGSWPATPTSTANFAAVLPEGRTAFNFIQNASDTGQGSLASFLFDLLHLDGEPDCSAAAGPRRPGWRLCWMWRQTVRQRPPDR